MELQFEKTAFPCLRQAVWEVQNQEQTQEIRLSDGMPDIGRVLGAWGQVLLRSKQWLTGGMGVSGGILVWVLYAPEDGSDPRCVDTWIPFQMNWDFPDTERDGVMQAACLLKSVDARSVSARKLMTRACVSILGEALEPVEVDIYQPGELPEDVQVLRKSYPVRIPREAGEKAFFLDEELTMPSSAPAIEKVICFQLQPELQDQKIMSEKVVFRGSANLHILYRAEDGGLKTWDFEIPFSQYTDLERSYEQNAAARIVPAVTSLELEQGEDDTLRLKAGLVGQYVIYDERIVETVEDAYSPNRPVTIQTQRLNLPILLEERRETMRAEQPMPISSMQSVDVSFCMEQPRCRQRENVAEIEIPGTFQLLYWDENGALQSGTARWDGRMELTADTDCRVDAMAFPVSRPQAVLGGENTEVSCEVLLDVLTAADQGLPMVTALELGEATEPDPARPSLILRRTGEDRLWDVAKQCGSTVESIRQVNHLTGEPEPDQLLLIPVF